MKKRKRYLLKVRERFSLKIYNGLLLVAGIFLIAVFSAWNEEYQILVAGTATDSVVVSVQVLDVISLSSPSDISLSPNISGTGTSTGQVAWEVVTSNNDGWKLEINSDTSPAMKKTGGASFADYSEDSSGVPEAWDVSSSDSEFGFSVEGDHALAKYSSGTLYQGLEGSTKIEIAESPGVSEADTTVKFKAEVGTNKAQESGTYSATIVATATSL